MSYTSDTFSLSIEPNLTSTNLWLQIHSSKINTKHLPNTLPLLQKYLPSVLETECFNSQNLPFCKEVVATEIGHLFEHILLEYLTQGAASQKNDSFVFNGRTNWDWKIHPVGSFSLTIDAGTNHSSILNPALKKTIHLTELILNSQPILQLND